MEDYIELNNIFEPHTLYESQMIQSDLASCISSPECTDNSSENTNDPVSIGYSDSETEVFEKIETTYQLIGIATRRSYWEKEQDWWVVEINDPEQVSKINIKSLISISGLFKYDDNTLLYKKNVLVEVTYNNKGIIQYKKNKIIGII